MADHDRRREAMRKQRSEARKSVHGNQEVGNQRNFERVVDVNNNNNKGEVDGDPAGGLRDLSYSCLPCTAKAA